MEQEIWKDVIGFEGLYKASNLGRIKSLSNDKQRKERVLKPINMDRYQRISLCKNGKVVSHLWHRVIYSAFNGSIGNMFIDHINGEKMDNRLINLRVCTLRENLSFDNIKRKKPKPSKYIGVTFCKQTNKWRSRITVNKKVINIGFFIVEEDAHFAYQKELAIINEI